MMSAMVQLWREAVLDGQRVAVAWLNRVPAPVLVAAPAFVLLAIALVVPDDVRRGFATDLELYHRYGSQLLAGLTPYRDVPIEYPPLAIVPMLVPFAIGPEPPMLDLATYTWRFVLVSAVLASAAGWLLWRHAERPRPAVALWTCLVAASWVAAAYRYDLWPGLATLAAVVLAQRRPGLAGLAIGAGALLKLFPMVVAAVLAASAIVRRDWAGLGRLSLGVVLVLAVVGGWSWAVAGLDSLGWLRYQEDRGLQLESLGASLILGLHLVAGLPVGRDFEFGAVEVVAPGSTAVVAFAPWLQLGFVAAALALALRRFVLDRRHGSTLGLEAVALASAAAIGAGLLGSKVLSMQYLLWLLPLVPLLGTRIRWLAVVLAVMTTVVYTLDYEGLWRFEPAMIALLLAKNALLVVFVGVLVRALWVGDRTAVSGRLRPAPGPTPPIPASPG